MFVDWIRVNDTTDNCETSFTNLHNHNENDFLPYGDYDNKSNDGHIFTNESFMALKQGRNKLSNNKEAYYMLLLHLDIELKNGDIKAIAQLKNKSVNEINAGLNIFRQKIETKKEKLNENRETILNLNSKIRSIENKIKKRRGQHHTHNEEEIKTMEIKLSKTREQRDGLKKRTNRSIVSYEDIANFLDVSKWKVLNNIKKTKEELREELKKEFKEE